jgi:phage shock protein A
MASQQSILGRIAQLARANIHNLIDAAEDPQIMLDQMIRDYTESIREAEAAVAQTLGGLRLMEEDMREDERAAAEWGSKAKAASAKADEMRASGQTAEAEKFDNLARLAIKKQIDFENEKAALKPTVDSQTVVVDKLRAGLDGMKGKLDELKSKRDELVARARVADAQNQVQDAIKAVDLTDPTSEIGRFEDKIRREEARARGAAELAESSLDAQFEDLESAETDVEVEARLASLKSTDA